MKILLIEPISVVNRWPIDLVGTRLYFHLPPLSLLQLGAFFPAETRIIDGVNDPRYTPEVLARILKQYNRPECVVGIGSHSQLGAINAFYTLRLVRAYAPLATTILGGYHGTFFHRKWVKCGADLVIRNEGELTFNQIVGKVKAGEEISREDLAGTTYAPSWQDRHNRGKEENFFSRQYHLHSPGDWQEIRHFPVLFKRREYLVAPDRPFMSTLDDNPLPKREMLDLNLYSTPIPGKGFSTTIEMARGCPFRCAYCSTGVMWRWQQRYKSLSRIKEEISECVKLGIRKFMFTDESWGINQKRDMELLKWIQEEDLNIRFGVQFRTETVRTSPDLIHEAGKAGCRMALVGFESVIRRLMDYYNKKAQPASYLTVRNRLNAAGICVFGYFMVGHPEETDRERELTIRTMRHYCDIAFLIPYMPYVPSEFVISEEKPQHAVDPAQAEKISHINPIPVKFYLNTGHLRRYINDERLQVHFQKVSRDLLQDFVKFFLDPRQLRDLFFAKRTSQKIKRSFLLFVWKQVIWSLFRFHPRKFLNLWEKYPVFHK